MTPADAAGAVLKPRRSTAAPGTAVERREAPRARSRRSSRGERSVARAAPEARASGNIRPRGAAHDFGASRRFTPASVRGVSCNAFAKLGRASRRENDFVFPKAARFHLSPVGRGREPTGPVRSGRPDDRLRERVRGVRECRFARSVPPASHLRCSTPSPHRGEGRERDVRCRENATPLPATAVQPPARWRRRDSPAIARR